MTIVETHVIEGTPFTALKKDDDKFLIAMGNQIVSETEFDSLQDVQYYCELKPYDLIASMVLILCNHLLTTKELQNE